jgi:hypothetical protein
MRARRRLASVALLGAVAAVSGAACSSATGGGNAFNGTSGGNGGGGGAAGNGGNGATLFNPDGGGGAGGILPGTPACNQNAPDVDADGDGFTPAQGDCNECTDQMNPGAYDYAGNGVDEDCNGKPDDEDASCDQGLPIGGNNAMDAAKSLGICRVASGATWGLVSAKWVAADGTPGHPAAGPFGLPGCAAASFPNPMSHGLLPKFGNVVKPRSGSSLVALSSGVAREGTNPADQGTSPDSGTMCTQSGVPAGFPKDSPQCNVQTAQDPFGNDPSGLELVIKVPTNAHALSYNIDFYTYEWPGFVCDVYNDFFVALLTSQAPGTPADKNISFDSQGAPVSVNNGLVDVCQAPPGPIGNNGQKTFKCSLGPGELGGTGFEQHAATSWLQTTAGVVPGETITLRFAIWDMNDEILDSTILIDNFAWDVKAGAVPVTTPVPK